MLIRDLHLLTGKPVMYVANVDESGFTNNPAAPSRARDRQGGEGAVRKPVCAAIEAEISQLEEADRADFLKELKLDEPGSEPGAIRTEPKQMYTTTGRLRIWPVC